VSHPGHMAEVPCSAGKYFSAFTCLACRTDTFTSLAGKMSCEDCDPGTYTDLENGSTVCRVCDAGKEMTGELGSRECLGCDPGKISVFGENCTDCGRGSYANSGKTACVLCEKGTWSSALGANDTTTCRNCSLGRYSSATGVSEESGCNACPPGKYSNGIGNDNTDACKVCASDTFSAGLNATSCEFCPSGYHTSEGRTICDACPAGWQMTGELGSRECAHCVPGKISASGGNCTNCTGGSYANQLKTVCVLCPKGTWSADVGANDNSTCRNCSPGRYSSAEGVADVSGCNACSPGKFSNEPGNTDVGKCRDCPTGYFQSLEGNSTCQPCLAGEVTPKNGSSECTRCELGEFSANGACHGCESGLFTDKRGSTECRVCPSEKIANPQSTACENPPWITAADCTVSQYLDDRKNQSEWSCEACREGISCADKHLTLSNLKSAAVLFGWARCPSTDVEKCPFSAACLGASNPALYGKYKGDPARLNHNESCNEAYQGFLCGACAPGFSHIPGDLSGKCDRCPEPGANSAVAAVGMLLAVLGIFVYIRMTLSDGGSKDTADGIKSIGLSFVQIISLLATFPVPWARMFTTLFQIGGAVTVLGQHFVNLKCMLPSYSEAEVFYSSRIAWALLPPLLSGACVLTWVLIHGFFGWGMGRPFRDKLRTTIAALLYLIWAGLCSEVFALFACRDLCGEYRLRADVEELCFEGRHWNYAVFLGVPMLLVYVIGFPVGALVAVWRLHRRAELKNKPLDECAGHQTWGGIYSSFREETWWWEGTVAARKVVVASIGVFGANLGRMQVHVTLILVFLIILLTAMVKPYANVMLHWLEIGSLSALYATLWSASVFLTYPHCERQGESIAWCEFIAILVGSADIVVTLLVITLFLRAKGGAKCLDARFAVRTRARAVSVSVGRGVTDLFDRMRGQEVVLARRQTRIRANTVDATDGSVQHPDNPLEGIEMAVLDAAGAPRRKFERHETEDGETFFVEEGTEES
jgi:hypothetical protein